MTQGDPVVIIDSVQSKIENVRTKSLDVSFNEILDMLKSEELIIEPEYQRLFRWSDGKQSRFIESLILEMPVPPIFVIEVEDGKFELIDGLQRIGSYLHFRGEHANFKSTDEQFLRLTDCDIVHELNALTYEDLPQTIKIKLKRSFVRMEVIRKESDQRLRYYMFKRLNTGGAQLSDQEIRNCTVRLLNNTFNDFLIRMSRNDDFRVCISNVSDEKQNQKYDQELVLRFFAFKNWSEYYTHDVSDFLTDYMEMVTIGEVPFDYSNEEACFCKSFKILNRALGDKAFSGMSKTKKLIGRFYVYHYEAFISGIQPFLDILESKEDAKLTELFTSIKEDDSFVEMTTGGGKNTTNQLKLRVEFVSQKIRDYSWT